MIPVSDRNLVSQIGSESKNSHSYTALHTARIAQYPQPIPSYPRILDHWYLEHKEQVLGVNTSGLWILQSQPKKPIFLVVGQSNGIIFQTGALILDMSSGARKIKS